MATILTIILTKIYIFNKYINPNFKSVKLTQIKLHYKQGYTLSSYQQKVIIFLLVATFYPKFTSKSNPNDIHEPYL